MPLKRNQKVERSFFFSVELLRVTMKTFLKIDAFVFGVHVGHETSSDKKKI